MRRIFAPMSNFQVGHSQSPDVAHRPLSTASPPRRRTLCTDDARNILPRVENQQELPSTSSSSPRRAARAHAPNMSIDIRFAAPDNRGRIRPLPIPPTPRSAPPVPHQQFTRTQSTRPLPCVPELNVSISVTPSTPVPPPTPIVESHAHLAPPCPRPGPPRFASLSLRVQTSPDALQPRVLEPPLPSPATPSIPEPPSPRTAERNRISKLRRHLGESVQLQLVLDRPDKADVLAELRHVDKGDVYPEIAVKKVIDFDFDGAVDNDSDTSSEGDGDDRENFSWAPPPQNRMSRKWIRERGGERWVDGDFSKILRDLRAL
ncbi:hypothetical protein B0H10DRAFT_1989220 [Mycena sp. CBHHK59/15]|nr:hypothetical protein B0H10DRAFT_1989220 [Mycena sp. CBHHK59/15]